MTHRKRPKTYIFQCDWLVFDIHITVFLGIVETYWLLQRVDTLAELIWHCRWLIELQRSGLVCIAAYWSDPTKTLKWWLSSFLTVVSSEFFWLGLMIWVECYWNIWLAKVGCCYQGVGACQYHWMWMILIFRRKRYFFSSLGICWWKNSSPPWRPAPESFPLFRWQST